MRKTFEAIQAWRRLHNGRYPGRLVDLKSSALVASDAAICPNVRGEFASADAFHNMMSSRKPGGDPGGTYEYEMSDKVDKWEFDKPWLPSDTPAYTRQDLKAVLLRRQYYEQVPILRCSSHRAAAPSEFTKNEQPFRNLTVEAKVYWSGKYWEKLWLADVPYCARDANVLFGLKGPPFYTNQPPALPEALDLRPWSCAFGDHAWWWTYPMFEQKPNLQRAANLRPFFEERHGSVAVLGDDKWWLNGLVQLQGRILTNNNNVYREPGALAFVWERKGLRVGRAFRKASWLQGTVWEAREGETTGWLVWNYADGLAVRVPLDYGRTTARFWGDLPQVGREKGFPQPVWNHHQSPEEVGKERWLRLYQQSWENPHPDRVVTTLDFVSNKSSPAAPFIIAVNLAP